jgi:hypothetical protein
MANWQTQYQVTINANPSTAGTLSPSGTNIWVNEGELSVSAGSNAGYAFTTWAASGHITVASTTSPTTIATINGTGTLTANFELIAFTITASANANGNISPSGSVGVSYGGSQSFIITPNSGYHIDSVLVDNVPVGAVSSYAFNNVTASHTIVASFAINTYTITVTSSHGSPTASAQVNYGGSFTASVTSPEPIDETHQWVCTGYSVDGGNNVNDTSYTFTDVTADHTIVFNWQARIIITPITATQDSNGTELTTGTPFTFETSGNITATQISNPTMIINETENTVTLSMNLTGPSGTTGFCNMTIPKSTMPAGVIPTPIVYIDGQLAEQQGYSQDADNFYVWYSTHFSDHIVDVIFPATATEPTSTPTPTPTPTPTSSATATATPTQTVTPSASPSTSPSAQATQQPEPSNLIPVFAGAIAIAIIAIVFILLVAKRKKKKSENQA